MSAPTQSNPAYKKRLIDAMLHEPASRDQLGSRLFRTASWSPKLVWAAAGLTLLSGLAVFLFLFHHDTSASASSNPLLVADEKENAGLAAVEHVVARDTATGSVSPSSAPLGFKLKRSRTFERIGPIGLRLLRVNLRRRTCDLSMQLNDHRTVQKRVQLNKPLEIKGEPSAEEPLQILVSSIARNSIAGVIANSPVSSGEVNRN